MKPRSSLLLLWLTVRMSRESSSKKEETLKQATDEHTFVPFHLFQFLSMIHSRLIAFIVKLDFLTSPNIDFHNFNNPMAFFMFVNCFINMTRKQMFLNSWSSFLCCTVVVSVAVLSNKDSDLKSPNSQITPNIPAYKKDWFYINVVLTIKNTLVFIRLGLREITINISNFIYVNLLKKQKLISINSCVKTAD